MNLDFDKFLISEEHCDGRDYWYQERIRLYDELDDEIKLNISKKDYNEIVTRFFNEDESFGDDRLFVEKVEKFMTSINLLL